MPVAAYCRSYNKEVGYSSTHFVAFIYKDRFYSFLLTVLVIPDWILVALHFYCYCFVVVGGAVIL